MISYCSVCNKALERKRHPANGQPICSDCKRAYGVWKSRERYRKNMGIDPDNYRVGRQRTAAGERKNIPAELIRNDSTAEIIARQLKISIEAHPDYFWRAEIWLGVDSCPWVLHNKYNIGTTIANDDLLESANEGCLPTGLVLRRMDGVRWVVVCGECDSPQHLVDYSPRPDEMDGLPLLKK